MNNRIPFVDLKAQLQNIYGEIEEAIKEVVFSTSFVLGDKVKEFENEFATYCGTKYCVGVNSGTDALVLSLRALEIGHGDEVITVPNTFIATAAAISLTGAYPQFVEINPDYYTMSPEGLEEFLKQKTVYEKSQGCYVDETTGKRIRAVIPVHLYGQPCDLDSILEISREYHLKVVEDACQAHGARYKGRRVGSIGDIGTFSFYPGKNLGAYGDGGAIVTNDREIAYRIEILRDHGSPEKYVHKYIGVNSRLDSMQAAILTVKLKYLDAWNENRRSISMLYSGLLNDVDGIVTPKVAPYAEHVWHLYVIRVKNRDMVQRVLRDREISTNIHYPIPIHLQKAYSFLELNKGSFPFTEDYSQAVLSIPIYADLEREQIEYIVHALKEAVRAE
jgi:dTDP-4-amino-4,6-dideoxygalactose transaminase